MFYSTELLGRKSPLGQVWIAAHGRRLVRSKLAGVDVVQICDNIMRPEVPQALRLQGILMGGVVIIYSRQTHFLLEDCKEVMKKINTAGAVRDTGANTLLQRNKANGRAEAITLPEADEAMDMQLDLPLLESTFDADITLGSDVFLVRGTAEEAAEHEESGRLGEALLSAGRGPALRHQLPPDPAPFEMDGGVFEQADLLGQPEMFEQVDMDMPLLTDIDDLPPMPELAPSPDALPPPAEITNMAGEDVPGTPKLLQKQQEIMPATPQLEDKAEQRQKKRRENAERKRFTSLVIDRTDGMQVSSKKFREWIVERSDLLTERPAKAPRRGSAAAGPLAALQGPPMSLSGVCAAPLLEVFRASLVPHKPRECVMPAVNPEAPGEFALNGGSRCKVVRQKRSEYAGLAPGSPPQLDIAEADDLPLPEAPEPMDIEGPYVGDLQVERLRAALNSPARGADMLRTGLTPSSNATAPGTGGDRRRRSRTVGQESLPALSDRSTPRSRAGSAELQEDAAGPAGRPEDLLPTVHEDELPPLPDPQDAEEGLTQFQLAVDSGRGTGSSMQLTPSSSLSRSTLLMLQVLRQRFDALDVAPPDTPSLRLSKVAAGLTRQEAARLFYQICSSTSNRYLVAKQETPHGDITLYPGALM